METDRIILRPMKKSILSIILAVAALTATAQNTYTLNFDPVLLSEELAKENVKIDSFYLADFVSQEPITEKFALQGNKIAISGKVDNPQIAALILEMKIEYGIRTNRFPLFLEAGDIVITQDDWMSCRVEGTPLNDAMFTATREIGQASEAGDRDKAIQLTKDYILAHRNDLTAALMLTALPHSTVADVKKVLPLISQCGEVVQQHPLTIQYKERLNKLLTRPQEGDRFRDFAVEYEGKTTRLSDYVGRGKYVLVDFWASWCGPCRKEILNIIAAHEKYKDRNFTALGVAVKDKPEATLRAIKDESVPYPQILNSQAIASELYGIDAIPEIILFAPNGTILARGLRGNEIEKKLAEIFGE